MDLNGQPNFALFSKADHYRVKCFGEVHKGHVKVKRLFLTFLLNYSAKVMKRSTVCVKLPCSVVHTQYAIETLYSH